METKTITTKNMKIMKKYLYLAAALAAMVSCSDNSFVGENGPNGPLGEDDGAIAFGGNFKAVTRADKVGADAAALLGNKFYVTGVKGDGTGIDQTPVFKTYSVEWGANTAGTKASNTADWEYVGKTHDFSASTSITSQTIKFWDYATTAYDYCAYSLGTGSATGTAISYAASEITPSTNPKTYKIDAAYTLTGSRDDLTKCYITDMKTVKKANYGGEVELSFRSLASKVRMALYETVPGYSVQNVHFYTNNETAIANNTTISETNAILFGGSTGATNGAFFTAGTYTVSFPHIGSANETANASDYNKAHVAMAVTNSTTTQSFGALQYTDSKLATASNNPTFAGTTSPYYVTMLPNETGAVLEMRVNYELLSDDGSGEVITIHGAKAFVPQVYTKWLPNYAYTYIFKISDGTNGWTDPTGTDPAGLYPITFDAVVLDPIDTDNEQTTITTVAAPSITTYQKDHLYGDADEYTAAKGAIYVRVMDNSATPVVAKTDLNSKGKLYTVTTSGTAISEATVMDALNIVETGTTGRNGITVTEVTPTFPTTIVGPDGNNITVTGNSVAQFTPSAATYAYVYDYTTGTPTAGDVYTAVQLTTDDAPSDFTTKYFKKNADGTYTQCVAGDYTKDNYYYVHYTNLNHTYSVKIIKVV